MKTTGMSAGFSSMAAAAARQASRAVVASAVRCATVLRVRSRRSLSTWAVVSVTAQNTPPMPPDSSRIGLYEKVK